MVSLRRSRLTIGQGMVVIAVLAGMLAVPRPRTFMELAIATAVLGLLPAFLLTNVLVGIVFGSRCPGCGGWTLRRLAKSRAYYRCSSCQGRFKRFGFGPWLDASGDEDDARYRGKSGSKPWLGYVAPEESSGTIPGALLRSKRARQTWELVLRAPVAAWSKAVAGVAKSRARPPGESSSVRGPGETTSGVLLRNKKARGRRSRRPQPAAPYGRP